MSSPRFADRIAARWAALSTGIKMFVILSLGLLPLGVIAIAASMRNAEGNRSRGEADATAMLAVHVQRLTLPLARHSLTIRAARDAIIAAGAPPERACARTLDRLSRLPGSGGRYALFGEGGDLKCLSPGFRVPAIPRAAGEAGRVEITPDGELLRIFLYDPAGAPEGVVEFPRTTLAALVNTPPLPGEFGVELVQGPREMPLRTGRPGGVLAEEIVVTHPLANGQYELRVHASVRPLTASDLLIIMTPVLMWLWASAIGWFLVQRLLLQPLKQIERAISAYRPGDAALSLPRVRSPAHEITALGQAFDTMTRTVARHEADLEAGLERQRRLVREVHHRVKNNLQVVASLLNIHSRGATDESATSAYAAIQRRVDALAVVHRNHFAELEENRGVALRPLVSELAANLRASAPTRGAAMQIRLDVDPSHVSQDVAVSVAFLITEIVEFGMLCGATTVSISVERGAPATARLAIEMDGPAEGGPCDETLINRFDRIITGLARQLRAPLEREPKRGLYAIDLPVIGDADEETEPA
ncbi:sensor histidine kinase [Sphingosinicella sp.]|uniref:sensor histidine kinase n=1 Tax=Sphingosinicella sp. TaxID=1917971 RepID=UPI004037B049